MNIWKPHAAALLSLALALPARATPEDTRSPTRAVTAGARVPGASRLELEPWTAAAEPVLHTDVSGERWRRRRPWLATLCISGATLVVGAVLGGLALYRARGFQDALTAGLPTDELIGLRAGAQQLAFSTDILLGTAALLGAATLVLRFGTAPSKAPEPVDLERAYQVPGPGEGGR